MVSPSSQRRFGSTSIVRREDRDDEPAIRQYPGWTYRQGPIIWLMYLLLTPFSLIALLYVVIPGYLSGYYELSISEIEYSNLWLWDYTDYPLYFSGWSGIWIALGLWSCAGFPILCGLIAELFVNWSNSRRRTRVLKSAILLLSITVAFLMWLSGDKLSVLLWD